MENRQTLIYGTLICQNAISEIRRCIESVRPVVDEYYVMDGGSTDGTWEMLNDYKDVYGLTLFQSKYEDQGAQRNKLRSKLPKNIWVVNLDQDEELNMAARKELRQFLNRVQVTQHDLPLTLAIKNINLVKDMFHYDASLVSYFATKIFYYDKNLHFTPGYHMSIHYFDNEQNINSIPCPEDFVIKHYAWLDKKRRETAGKDNKRAYGGEEGLESSWDIRELPEEWY